MHTSSRSAGFGDGHSGNSTCPGEYLGRESGLDSAGVAGDCSHVRVRNDYRQIFDPLLLKQDWQEIRMTMWNYAGIVRSTRGLKRARADLGYFSHRIFNFYQNAELNREIIELRNAAITAGIIVAAAQHNRHSIGCHYRRD